MTEQGNAQKQTRLLAWAALLLALLAAAIATASFLRPPPVETSSDYDRVVIELWQISDHVYDDFDLQRPSRPPRTLAEVLQPLFQLVEPMNTASESAE